MNVKEFSFSCVSLFNYQGSCRLTAPTFYHIVFRLSSTFLKSFFRCLSASLLFCDSHTRLSHLYLSVKNFFKLFQCRSQQLLYINILTTACQHFFVTICYSGERGIWTLARCKPSIPLAGAPLQPLEYFSNAWINHLFNYLLCMSKIDYILFYLHLSMPFFKFYFFLYFFKSCTKYFTWCSFFLPMLFYLYSFKAKNKSNWFFCI